jgi:predicted HTH transcriptional regulator
LAQPQAKKIQGWQSELEIWLLQLLSPKINFCFMSITVESQPVVLLEIILFIAIRSVPSIEYIRVGSIKTKLKSHPEKERELWQTLIKRV